MVEQEIIIETRGMTKHYGGVKALNDVDFVLRADEQVAIVGDNGAGKSTFVRNITSVEKPTVGEIVFRDQSVQFYSPFAAREAGIETVNQTLAIADHLDVAANFFVGREENLFRFGPLSVLNKRKMRRDAEDLLNKTGIKIPDMRQPLMSMSGGQRQCVAITRAAGWGAKLIIMDEPTAALGVQETTRVENIIQGLREGARRLSWSRTTRVRCSNWLIESSFSGRDGSLGMWTPRRSMGMRSSHSSPVSTRECTKIQVTSECGCPIRVPLREPQFDEVERVLLDMTDLSVTSFRCSNGIAALRRRSPRSELLVLPFVGQQIWRATFDGRDVTMQSMFDEPVHTERFLETYGAFFLHCGLTGLGAPGDGVLHEPEAGPERVGPCLATSPRRNGSSHRL